MPARNRPALSRVASGKRISYRAGHRAAAKGHQTSPFNPRHFYLKASIAELAVNLAKQGQQQAIHVIPDYENPGTYFVSDGGRRVRALKEANKETVKAIVIDLPIGIESYKLGYDLNVQRDSQTVFDNAVVWKRFLEEKHFQSQRELAEHLGPRRIDHRGRLVDREAARERHA